MASLLPNGKQAFSDAAGRPLVGGRLYTYAAGTNTPLPTFAVAGGTVPNTNPIVLDARGEATIFWSGAYKVVLRDALDNLIWSQDDVTTIDPLAGVLAGFQTSLAGTGGSVLVGFTQAGMGAVLRTVQDKSRETISLLDFYLPTDADHTAALLKAVAAINAGIGRALLITSDINLSSTVLKDNPPKITRDGVAVIGRGKPQVTITGTDVILAILNFENCSGTVSGIGFTGNGQGQGYVNGSALWFTVTPSATKDTEYVDVLDCTFENFKSPYWVYANVTSSNWAIARLQYRRNYARARNGNSLLPGSQGQINAVLVAKSKVSNTDGGGGVRNVLIESNVIDATYIKTGVFLADKVQGAIIRDNKVIGAGVEGATDAAGAYAFASYDSDGVGMRNITFAGNEVDGVRSVGIYCAGVQGLSITATIGRDQTDINEVFLPKGMIVLNGCIDFVIDGVKADNIAANPVYMVPSSIAGQTNGIIRNVDANNSRNAVFLKSAFKPSLLEIDGIYARNCPLGIAVTLDDSGLARLWNISRLNIQSSLVGSMGVRVFTEQAGTGYDSITIGGNSVIATRATGVAVPGLTAGRIAIRGISFNGPFSTAAVSADSAYGLDIDNLSFNGQDATGYSFRLSAARGHLGLGLKFNGVDAGRLIALSGSDLGTELPTFSASRTTKVANLNAAPGGPTYWINVDGGSSWRPAAMIPA